MLETLRGKFTAVWRDKKVIKIFLFGFTLALAVLYVIQVNTASTKGFAMRDLQQNNQVLKQDNEKLSAEIDRLRSLASVSERQAFLGLVKLQNVSYLTVTSSEMALR